MVRDPVSITVATSVVGGVFAQALARKLRTPAIIPLLCFGVLLGPGVLGVVQPAALGEGLRVLVGIAVAVILFEGGLSLKSEAFRFAGKAIRNMVLIGSLITWGLAATAAYFLFPSLGIGPSVLFGSLVIVTGPTVIQPLIHAVHPRKRVADILRGEGILIDPVGALYAVLVLEFLLEVQGGHGVGHVLGAFGKRILLGVVVGGAGAFFLDRILRSRTLAPDLRNLAVLSAAIGLYAASEAALGESGVLTVTLAGFLLGWLHPPGIEEIEEFKGAMTLLMVSTVFILLSANLSLPGMAALGMPGLLLVAALIFIVRPVSVFFCTLGTDLSRNERLFLSWIAPRGIVAAAISSLFAILLEAKGHTAGTTVMNMTFAVIVGTVLIQGPTARFVGSLLGVLEEARNGFLIIGGNIVGQRLGHALDRAGLRVLLVDTNGWRVQQARKLGLNAKRSNALDEVVMEELDLDGIGNLIAVTPNDSVNRLALRLYARDFGEKNVRAVQLADSPLAEDVESVTTYLFGTRLTYEALCRRLEAGEEIRTAEVDEDVSVEELTGMLEGGTPLIALDATQRARWLEEGAELAVGDKLFYLAPE